ncbi:MAG TPA: amidohydrolase [Patescibacteria group bacterium]|nr:amidohydrolase [Patescibacteria group bacterium]
MLYSEKKPGGCGQAFAQEINMPKRYALINANVISMDKNGRRWDAVAVKDDSIYRLGLEAGVQELVDEGWPVYDMGGQSILPGFIDCHSHLEYTGAIAACLDGRHVTSIEEIIGEIARAAEQIPKGQRVILAGVKETDLAEGRGPNRWELDRATLKHPVIVLEYTWHQMFFNSLALEQLNICPNIAGVDVEAGTMTGVLRDPIAADISTNLLLDLPEKKLSQGIIQAAWFALAKGVTTIHSMQGGKKRCGGTERLRNLASQLPVHLLLWEQSADISEVLRLQLPRFGGCGDLQADGEVGSYTAALLEPYSDRCHCRGLLNYPQEYWDRLLTTATENQLQFCAHAEGDAGIEAVLSAMEKAQEQSGRSGLRHRIEHLELPTMQQLQRMAEAGIIASVQPAFMEMEPKELTAFHAMYGERIARLNPFRSIRQCGVMLAGGSDSPVTEYDPVNGIHCVLNHPIKQQRLPLREALKMFTINAAYSGFEEERKGSIEAGKQADMVVLSVDPYRVPPDRFRDLVQVRQVFVAGKRYLSMMSGRDC